MHYNGFERVGQGKRWGIVRQPFVGLSETKLDCEEVVLLICDRE